MEAVSTNINTLFLAINTFVMIYALIKADKKQK